MAVWTVGEIPTAAKMNLEAAHGRQFDYAQITANVTGITASTEGTAATVIAGASITYDGSTQVEIRFYTPGTYRSDSASNVQINYVLLRDSTVVAQSRHLTGSSTSAMSSHTFSMFDTPSSGAHTYTVKAFTTAGATVVVGAGAGGTGNLAPAFLRVTRA